MLTTAASTVQGSPRNAAVRDGSKRSGVVARCVHFSLLMAMVLGTNQILFSHITWMRSFVI